MRNNRTRIVNWVRGWCPKVSLPNASQLSGARANRKGERVYPYLAISLLLWFIVFVLNYLKQLVLAIFFLALATVFNLALLPRAWRFGGRKIVELAKEMERRSDLSSPFGGRDYLSLFFSNKGWIKLAHIYGIRKTTVIYFLFSMALGVVALCITISVFSFWNPWFFGGYLVCYGTFYAIFVFRRQISKALKGI